MAGKILFYQLALGIVISSAIALVAHKKEALSKSGVWGAIVIGVAIFGFGGWVWGSILITFFILSSLLSKYREEKKKIVAEKFAKGSKRDIWQALANGGAGAILAVFYCLTHSDILWFAFIGAMATVNADTWATELGVLSKRWPRLLTNWKRVEPGTSGGVSKDGLMASAAGGLAIGLSAVIFLYVDRAFFHSSNTPLNFTGRHFVLSLLIAPVAGFAGSLFDSLLGATVQAVYFSASRRKETEKPLDSDGRPNILLRGWPWLNNDWVNFFSSAAGAIAAAFLALLSLK